MALGSRLESIEQMQEEVVKLAIEMAKELDIEVVIIN